MINKNYTEKQIRKALNAAGFNPAHILEAGRNNVEVAVLDENGNALREESEALVAKVWAVLGGGHAFKTGYGSWCVAVGEFAGEQEQACRSNEIDQFGADACDVEDGWEMGDTEAVSQFPR